MTPTTKSTTTTQAIAPFVMYSDVEEVEDALMKDLEPLSPLAPRSTDSSMMQWFVASAEFSDDSTSAEFSDDSTANGEEAASKTNESVSNNEASDLNNFVGDDNNDPALFGNASNLDVDRYRRPRLVPADDEPGYLQSHNPASQDDIHVGQVARGEVENNAFDHRQGELGINDVSSWNFGDEIPSVDLRDPQDDTSSIASTEDGLDEAVDEDDDNAPDFNGDAYNRDVVVVMRDPQDDMSSIASTEDGLDEDVVHDDDNAPDFNGDTNNSENVDMDFVMMLSETELMNSIVLEMDFSNLENDPVVAPPRFSPENGSPIRLRENQLTPDDIHCGQGERGNIGPGNVRYHHIVETYEAMYKGTPHRNKMKKAFVMQLLDEELTTSRFVRKEPNGTFYVLTKNKAYLKLGGALRDYGKLRS